MHIMFLQKGNLKIAISQDEGPKAPSISSYLLKNQQGAKPPHLCKAGANLSRLDIIGHLDIDGI
jgi:hypothetical protein